MEQHTSYSYHISSFFLENSIVTLLRRFNTSHVHRFWLGKTKSTLVWLQRPLSTHDSYGALTCSMVPWSTCLPALAFNRDDLEKPSNSISTWNSMKRTKIVVSKYANWVSARSENRESTCHACQNNRSYLFNSATHSCYTCGLSPAVGMLRVGKVLFKFQCL